MMQEQTILLKSRFAFSTTFSLYFFTFQGENCVHIDTPEHSNGISIYISKKKVLSPTMFFTQQWYIFCNWKKSYLSPYFSPVGKWNDFPCHCVDQCKIGNTPKYLRNCNNHNIKIKIKKYIQNWSHKFFAFWFSFLYYLYLYLLYISNPNKWACLDSLVDSKASRVLQIIPDICQFRVNLGL